MFQFLVNLGGFSISCSKLHSDNLFILFPCIQVIPFWISISYVSPISFSDAHLHNLVFYLERDVLFHLGSYHIKSSYNMDKQCFYKLYYIIEAPLMEYLPFVIWDPLLMLSHIYWSFWHTKFTKYADLGRHQNSHSNVTN